jgi:hypothetical protein
MKSVLALSVITTAILCGQAAIPAPGNVALPLDEYNRLIDVANRPVVQPTTPPINHVLKSAEITLKVTGEAAVGTVRIDGEIMSGGMHKIPLVSDLIVLDARRDGNDLPLEQEGGVHSAVLNGPTEFAVALQAAIPIRTEPGRATFDIAVPASGAARLTLEVPGAETYVNISPGLVTRRTVANGITTIEATLVPGEKASLWWSMRLPVQQPTVQETRFTSDVKTLVSVVESELVMAALTEVTVLRGEPTEFRVDTPDGFELTSVTGPTLIASNTTGNQVRLTVGSGSPRSHQFLLSFSKSQMNPDAEARLVSFVGTQRETGEVLVDGVGAMELAATERGGLRRMDIKETSPYLRSLATGTLHAAFRYQKRATESPAVGLKWERFPESDVISAVAQNATATTLITSEGRSLTEIKLTLRNRAQPFLKVALPAGATILSSEVQGVTVKPVVGADGNRVPLFRPGFKPADFYEVSFVFVHSGTPFARKGDTQLTLPKLGIAIANLQWEVFLPDRYKVSKFGGDLFVEELMPFSRGLDASEEPVFASSLLSLPVLRLDAQTTGAPSGTALANGQIGGIVTDATGSVVPNVPVRVRHQATGSVYSASTDRYGQWRVFVPTGSVEIDVNAPGFKRYVRTATHDGMRFTQINTVLEVGAATESITVTSGSVLSTESAPKIPSAAQINATPAPQSASANVQDLQRRVAGVLPITVSVPKAGNSYRFVRTLVMDEETLLTFRYRGK